MNDIEEGGEPEGGQPPPVKKRLDYLQWEEYFMAVAFLSAQRSKDPNSQVRTRAWTQGQLEYNKTCMQLNPLHPLPSP